jgi:iron(III) transport system substrate-binding protein
MLRTLALFLLAAPAMAEPLVFPAPGEARDTVTIYSTLDERLAIPLVAAFQRDNPGTTVAYEDLLAADIHARILTESAAGGPTADLVISTGMDLQVKLANDGLAQPVDIPAAADWPRWANWRDTAFALTVEPAVLVYHRPSFPNGAPATRLALMDWLRQPPDDRTGGPVIGTYDIEASAVGYLYLSRDAEHFPDIWSLVATMGAAGLATFPTSQEIIDRVAAGDLALGYNVLGPYAAEQQARFPDLGIATLRDYTVAISRVALVPSAAANPDGGAEMLAFLMSDAGQSMLSRDLGLPTIRFPARDNDLAIDPAILRPVNVSAGLLAYLDQARRRLILDRWQESTGD